MTIHVGRIRAFRLGIGVLCAALALALAPRAEAFIYWTNTSAGTIGRANPNGSRVNQSFMPNAAGFGVTADGAHVYWTNFNEGTIGRANLNGSSPNPSFISGASFPIGVAIDAQHVYWANSSTKTIARANLDGSGTPDLTFITGDPTGGVKGVAVDAAHVYWTNYQDNSIGPIGRANLNGSSPDNAFIGDAFLPVGVAVNGTHIYWANQGTNAIARADLDGSDSDQSFIPGASNPEGVAVDGAHVYWANTNAGTIGRANLNGTGIDQSFITGAGAPSGVGVDGLSFPSCQPASASADHAEPVAMTLRCTSGGGTRTFSIASQPVHGGISSFNGSTGKLIYTPDPDFFGTDSFKFRASNQGGSSQAATATVEVAPASNDFTLGKVKKNKKKGTAKLTATVPGPGTLDLAGKGVKPGSKEAAAAGDLKLKIKAKGKKKKKLNSKGKTKVTPEVTYTPDGGNPSTESKKIKLVKR